MIFVIQVLPAIPAWELHGQAAVEHCSYQFLSELGAVGEHFLGGILQEVDYYVPLHREFRRLEPSSKDSFPVRDLVDTPWGPSDESVLQCITVGVCMDAPTKSPKEVVRRPMTFRQAVDSFHGSCQGSNPPMNTGPKP